MYISHSKIFAQLSQYLRENERGSLLIFFTIFFAIGIASYFNLKHEPEYSKTSIATAISILLLSLSFFRRRHLLVPSLLLTAFATGFFTANTKTIYTKSPKIDDNLGVIWLTGKLEDIDYKENFTRILVSQVDLWQPRKGKFNIKKTPKKIRLNVRTKISPDVSEGDIIKAKVKLSKPALLPVYPAGYDFAKYAYFKNIGAVGFAVTNIEKYKEKPNSPVKNIRNSINNKISNAISDKQNGEILKALLTAERSGIKEDIKKSIRESGLGHLLAISGMHMSIACIWFFTILRLILAFFPKISLNYDSKKISAIFSLALGFGYLMITELPISATRAYIMIALFLISILIDRSNHALRSVSIAALIILIFRPESLIEPGFQMSFASVIAIIGIYQLLFRNFTIEFNSKSDMSIPRKLFLYIGGIAFTTIIAGIATSPYAVYHFGQIPKYSVFSNLIAIPAITFITLPFLFLSIFLMPIGLESFALNIAEIGINIIRETAIYVSDIEGNIISKPAMPSWFLWLSSISSAIFFAFKSKIRFIALPFILLSFLTIIFYSRTPDFILDQNLKYFAVKDSNSLNYKFFGRKIKGYKISRWSEELGVNEKDVIFASKEDRQYCNHDDCDLGYLKLSRSFDKNDCDKYKFLIINGYSSGICPKNSKTIIFDKYYTQRNGSMIIYRDGRYQTSRGESGKRIWNMK